MKSHLAKPLQIIALCLVSSHLVHADSATWNGSAIVPATSGPVGAATVTVIAGTPSNAITDTVKISIPKTEAGGSGKLFWRLQVAKP